MWLSMTLNFCYFCPHLSSPGTTVLDHHTGLGSFCFLFKQAVFRTTLFTYLLVVMLVCMHRHGRPEDNPDCSLGTVHLV